MHAGKIQSFLYYFCPSFRTPSLPSSFIDCFIHSDLLYCIYEHTERIKPCIRDSLFFGCSQIPLKQHVSWIRKRTFDKPFNAPASCCSSSSSACPPVVVLPNVKKRKSRNLDGVHAKIQKLQKCAALFFLAEAGWHNMSLSKNQAAL